MSAFARHGRTVEVMERFLRLPVAVLATFLMAAGTALAQAPGDNGQIDQYTESIPSAEGNEPTGGGGGSQNGGGGDGNDSPVLTPEQSEGLAGQGADGAGVANLTEATAPSSDGNGGSSGSGSPDDQGSTGSATGGASSSDGGSSSGGLAGAFDAVGGSDDGLGIALPLILAAVAVAGIAIAWRRRTTGPPDPL